MTERITTSVSVDRKAWLALQGLAHQRTLEQGSRVSVSHVLRELVTEALARSQSRMGVEAA